MNTVYVCESTYVCDWYKHKKHGRMCLNISLSAKSNPAGCWRCVKKLCRQSPRFYRLLAPGGVLVQYAISHRIGMRMSLSHLPYALIASTADPVSIALRLGIGQVPKGMIGSRVRWRLGLGSFQERAKTADQVALN